MILPIVYCSIHQNSIIIVSCGRLVTKSIFSIVLEGGWRGGARYNGRRKFISNCAFSGTAEVLVNQKGDDQGDAFGYIEDFRYMGINMRFSCQA